MFNNLDDKKIAFLLTCHNRKEKTKHCLCSLFEVLPDAKVYLVDDGSTDGTSEMITSCFPSVNLIKGDGNLFWSRGMHKAWTEANKYGYDFVIWLNDDLILYDYFLDELFDCYYSTNPNTIITGIIVDRDTKEVIYGGYDKEGRLLQIDGKIQSAHEMNGNVVLVPKCVVDTIGIMDSKFHHTGGDTDYGYTAKENSIQVLTTKRAVAEGYINHFDRIHKWGTNLLERIKFLYSPLGDTPFIEFYFQKKHFGLANAIITYFYIHILCLLPDWVLVKRKSIFFKDEK